MSTTRFHSDQGYFLPGDRAYLFSGIALFGLLSLMYLVGYRRFHQSARESDLSPATPEEFTYPAIKPCFLELDELEPRLYRPFKSGPYHMNMGIRAMPWEDWIEVDYHYLRFHAIKTRRLQTRGPKVARCLPAKEGIVDGGEDAARELAEELAWFLSRKYPKIFCASFNGNKHCSASINAVTILPLGITYNLETEDPIHIIAQIVQDDFAILKEGANAMYYFVGGAILVAGSWRLDEKIGMTLDEIHLSGKVPKFKEKLQSSLTKFFRRLAVDTPYARNNYQFQVVDRSSPDELDPDDLAWCATTNGPEDAEPSSCLATLNPEGRPTPNDIVFRVERQTLRRLPRTKAVVFSIRTYLTPLEKLASEPEVPERLAGAVRGWSEDVWSYKKGNLYGDTLLEYLDSLIQQPC